MTYPDPDAERLRGYGRSLDHEDPGRARMERLLGFLDALDLHRPNLD